MAGSRGVLSRDRQLAAPGTPATRQRHVLIVSLLAYAGLRPGELRALRISDVRENTILVQRAANPDGSIKTTKTEQRRSLRLLRPLAQELREYQLAIGRPPPTRLLLLEAEGRAGIRQPGRCGASTGGRRPAEAQDWTRSRDPTTCATASCPCSWPGATNRCG